MSERHAEYASALRKLADWVETHPKLELPTSSIDGHTLNTRREAAQALMELKPCKKIYTENMFFLEKDFGGVKLRYSFYREAICKKKVVGKRIIEALTRPAQLIPAEHIPEHEEDIVEWECGESLAALAGDKISGEEELV